MDMYDVWVGLRITTLRTRSCEETWTRFGFVLVTDPIDQ